MSGPPAPDSALSKAVCQLMPMPSPDSGHDRSDMRTLIARFDWSRTPVGPAQQWPQSLKTALGITLASKFPLYVAWGPEFVQFYNDAYRPILGEKHPSALGQRTPDSFAEIWDDIGPLFHGVMRGDGAFWFDEHMLVLTRSGFPEECYFTFSYSPIPDESGGIGGVFVTVVEVTGRVLDRRRLGTLRDLATRTAGATSLEAVMATALEVLSENRHDLPVVQFDRSGSRSAGRAQTGDGAEPPLALTHLDHPLPPPEHALWPEPIGSIVTLELWSDRKAVEDLVIGLSPRLRFDESYRQFVSMVAAQLTQAMSSAAARQEERQRAEALAELDRAKTTFFNNISHEFRTPLTLMIDPLRGLVDSDLPDQLRVPIVLAHRNSHRLLRLVNALLDIARIEAGRFEAFFEACDLPALTADLAGMFRSAAERAGLGFVVDCPPMPESIYVDREMWEKVVLNLLSNALKYTPKGEIHISTAFDDRGASVVVEDTGVGIDPSMHEAVFDRFRRMPSSQGRSVEGSGLGLSLVRNMVRMHGGDVTVRSEPGRGSRFVVSLPRGRSHLPGAMVRPRPDYTHGGQTTTVVDEALQWATPVDPVSESDVVLPSGAAGHRPRVLIVDDNPDLRSYLTQLLSPACDIRSAGDGAEALAMVGQWHPHLVMADIMLPGMDGLALLAAVRGDSDPLRRATPFILLSARAGEEARVDGLRAGADDYIVKPFVGPELVGRVHAHLRAARLHDESAERERRLRESAEAARERMRFLAEASGLLNASLDVSSTLAQVARLAVPRIADCCVLHFVTPSGLDPVVVEHRDAGRAEEISALLRECPIADTEAVGIAKVARTGEPELYPEIPDDILVVVARDQHHLDRIRLLGLRSAIVVPLAARGQTLGVLSLAVTDSGRHFDEDDLEMALSLGRRAALAVDNARLYSEVASAAAQLEFRVGERTEALEDAASRLRHAVQERITTERTLSVFNLQLQKLAVAVQRVAGARDLEGVVTELRSCARELIGVEGIAVVLRDGGHCHYVDEDAMAPLWKGQRFPMEQCVSGWVMARDEPAFIEDVFADPRVPAELYRQTFVRSLAMVPLKATESVGALGCYWADHHQATPHEQHVLSVLADAAGLAVQHARQFEELVQSEQRLRESSGRLTLLSRQLIETQESERRRLSRDLHDQLGQTLTHLHFQLRQVQEAAPDQAADLDAALSTLDTLHDDVRTLALSLRPSLLDDLGLIPALRWHVSRFGQRGAVRLRFECDVQGELRWPPDIETAAFRVAQEALTNALRHSQAKGIAVRLMGDPTHLRLQIVDDGVGFDVSRAGSVGARTLGLWSMDERVRLAGGRLTVTSTEGSGTEVMAVFLTGMNGGQR